MDGQDSWTERRLAASDGNAVATYLRPKVRRREYGDRTVGSPIVPLPQREARGCVTVSHAIQAMLNSHALDWARPQLANCWGYLLSPTGRFQQWLRAEHVDDIDDLTTERIASFLAALADRDHGPGLKASTINKFRIHLRALARFQAETPGYGTALHDIGRIRAPRMPKERVVHALSRADERAIVAACRGERDGLIIELFLATGLRVSEMAGLTLQNTLITARPPRLVVVGSVHDPDCTKNRRPRQVPFRHSYNTLPRRLQEWISARRDPHHLSPRQELFLSAPDMRHQNRVHRALGIWGFESLCQRISQQSGVHFSPHMLRHTWATRLVDAGVRPMHLMEAGGWSSIEMVRRYYTANDDEVLAALARARA